LRCTAQSPICASRRFGRAQFQLIRNSFAPGGIRIGDVVAL